jgi:hypothetical protein
MHTKLVRIRYLVHKQTVKLFVHDNALASDEIPADKYVLQVVMIQKSFIAPIVKIERIRVHHSIQIKKFPVISVVSRSKT